MPKGLEHHERAPKGRFLVRAGWQDGAGEMELRDRVVIVTGASRGIGKGLAIGLAGRGALVVCAARTTALEPGVLPGTIHDTVAAIEDAGGRALAVRCDIGIPEDIERLVATAVDSYGRIDVLIN